MTVLAKALFEAVVAAAANTTQYTAPAATRTIIDKFTGTNTTAGVLTITVNIVASGGAAAAANTITSTKPLQPNESYPFPEIVGHVLNPGDFISTIASGAGITIRSSGREVT